MTKQEENYLISTAKDLLDRCKMLESSIYFLGSVLEDRKTTRPLDDFEVEGMASTLRIMSLYFGSEFLDFRKEFEQIDKGGPVAPGCR